MGSFISKYKYILIFALTSLLLSSFVISDGKMFFAIDYFFQMNRIIGLSESIKHFDFLNDIDFTMLNGLGYKNPIFYFNLFLLPFAVLKLIGFSNALLVLCVIFLISFFTMVISYYASNIWFKNNFYSFLFSIFYMFSNYHMFNVFYRGAFGELFGMLFLPIPLFAFIAIIYRNELKYWKMLAFGLLFVLLCHNITAFLLVILFIIIYSINIFKIENKKELTNTFVKSACLFFILSIFYIIPVLYSLKIQDLNVTINPVYHLSDSSSLNEYLNFTDFLTESIFNIPVSLNIGIVNIFALISGLFLFKKLGKLDKQFLVISFSLLFIMFFIMDAGYLDNTFIDIIQFPFRLYIIITPMASILFVNEISLYKNIRIKRFLVSLFLLVTVFSYVSYKYFMVNLLNNSETSYLYHTTDYVNNYKNYTYDIGSGREYLPSIIYPESNNYQDLKEISLEPEVVSGKAKISNYLKEYGEVSLNISTNSNSEIEIPYIYYPEYKATINGKNIETKMSDNGLLLIKIPKGIKGKISIKYEKPLVYYVGYFLSSSGLLLFFIRYKNKRPLN